MFQYVSIISVSTPAKFAILTKFTFQYVSIISDLKIKYLKQRSHLHSNMFLLFRCCSRLYDPFRNLFTFQYVSIISEEHAIFYHDGA